MKNCEAMTSTHSFAYSYRLFKKPFIENYENSKFHILIFNPISIKFSLFCFKFLTLSIGLNFSFKTYLFCILKTIFPQFASNFSISPSLGPPPPPPPPKKNLAGKFHLKIWIPWPFSEQIFLPLRSDRITEFTWICDCILVRKSH